MIKHRYYLFLIFIMIQPAGIFASAASSHPASPAKSNINEVTSFFREEIDGKADLDTTFIDMQNAAKIGIESGSSQKEIEMDGNSNAKASELSSISAHDLESKGMSARNTECSFYDENELELDYTSPLVARHKNDVDHILNGCDSFMSNILGGLKSLGIDCEQVAGNRVQEPEYNIYRDQVPSQDTVYDQKFCEHLRSSYRCNNILTTRCTQIIGRPTRLNVTSTNLPIIRHDAGYMQAGSHNPHWLYGGPGTLFNFFLSFTIPKVQSVESFTIGNLNYDDFVLIKLNDSYIWSGPYGGHKLELHGEWVFRHVAIDDSGRTFSPENATWFFAPLNINLKPYLRDGANSLNFTVVVGDKGGLLFDLHTKEMECAAWQDAWEEKCVLN